ncbi:hypothetical protein OEZ86_000625 [Tetradesmus obliquus]|nr:hypothetical protein OEZ86_000625 [Tetradesmus obliquus]
MDVQAAQWNAQLNRMVSLCMQEAAEYERGRTLQVLQPSLASLLQPSQRPVVAAANAQNAGQQSASGPVQTAVARDAAVAALPPAGAGAAAGQHHTSLELPHVGLVTPSKFFAGSPVATLGGAATRGSATGVGADVPQPVFATPSKFFSGSPPQLGLELCVFLLEQYVAPSGT